MAKQEQPICAVCEKPCEKHDLLNDGLYAHPACLQTQQVKPVGKGPKGGNLYA